MKINFDDEYSKIEHWLLDLLLRDEVEKTDEVISAYDLNRILLKELEKVEVMGNDLSVHYEKDYKLLSLNSQIGVNSNIHLTINPNLLPNDFYISKKEELDHLLYENSGEFLKRIPIHISQLDEFVQKMIGKENSKSISKRLIK